MDLFQAQTQSDAYPAMVAFDSQPTAMDHATNNLFLGHPNDLSTTTNLSGDASTFWQQAAPDAAHIQSPPDSVGPWEQQDTFPSYGKDQQGHAAYAHPDHNQQMKGAFEFHPIGQTSPPRAGYIDGNCRPGLQDQPTLHAPSNSNKAARRGRPHKQSETVKKQAASAQGAPKSKRSQRKRQHEAGNAGSTHHHHHHHHNIDETAKTQDGAARSGGSDEKKARLRMRNREAAHKCRQRKQRGVNDLQAQEAAAEAVNQALVSEASALRGEVLMLKNMILQHGTCDCPFIQDYINVSAASVAGVQKDSNISQGSATRSPAVSSSFSVSSTVSPRSGGVAVDSSSGSELLN